MISTIQGKLDALGADWAIINVGGIGFQVHMPASSLSALGAVHSDVKVYTHLYPREDSVNLYGFISARDLALFQMLISVSGLGPRLALAMLSTLSAEQLAMAIASGNIELLTIVPGIGKKVANRIILELQEKIAAGWVTAPVSGLARENADVLSALSSLGYSTAEASKAIAALPASADMSLEEKLKLVLQYLAGK